MNSAISRTNAIGTGTCNLPVNVPVDERAFWGKLATEAGAKSVGELHRIMWLLGLQQAFPGKAEELREIRRRYYGAVMMFLFCGALAASWVNHNGDIKRRVASRRARTVRVSRGGRVGAGFRDSGLEFNEFTGGLLENEEKAVAA